MSPSTTYKGFLNTSGGGDSHFAEWPVPAPDHSLGEGIFPNIQPEYPMVQLEAIPSCLIACYR